MSVIMSTGQITLVDLTDQRTSSFYLQADKSKIQIANVNASLTTYTPDYSISPLTISPSFFFGNEKVSLANKDVTYYINEIKVTTEVNSDAVDPSNNNFFVKGGNLIIKQNIPAFGASVTQLRVRAVVGSGLVDTQTGLPTASDIEATIEFALVESGKDGTSINNIETYYNTTTQYVAPNISDSGWDQDASKFVLSATNKYLWSYQKTYYIDNAGVMTSKNGNVFLAGTYGDTGATGAEGRSVYSITEEYYVSTSAQYPAGGAWSTTAPSTLTTNQYLWTRTAIVYKNSDGSTTDPSYLPNANGALDATWNLAVNEVKKTNEALTKLQSSYDSLQNQVDGSIDTWYGQENPTSDNIPEKDWIEDVDKIRHNGDLYYNTETGAAWRYVVTVDGNGNFASATWTAITDAALTEALKEIQEIGAIADKKMTIFYGGVSEVPASAQEGDLWIQGENGDQYKCIATYTSGVDSNNWTEFWSVANKSIGKVDILFYKNDSSTIAPGDDVTWSTTSPEWEQGKYIWQRTRTYDRSGNIITQSAPVCITSASRSIFSITNYYLATNLSTGVTVSGYNWTTDVSKAVLNKDAPYLWNYEKVEYTYGNPDISDPTIIGNYSKDGENGTAGRGIESITEYYLISNSSNTPSFLIDESGMPTSSEWKAEVLVSTDDKPYLWNAEVVKYTSAPIYEASTPTLIGYRGVGIESATVYYKRNNSTTAPDIDASWSTVFTDVDINNKYLWSYTKTIFTDGSHSDSTPAIIARYTKDGADAVFGLVEAEGKTIFSDQDSTAITLTARFMVGGEEIESSSVKYVWTAIGSAKTGTGQTLSVNRADVTNVATFICTMTHDSYGTVTDRITLQDKADPVWCEITSSRGDKFTNGNTSTVLTATLYGAIKGKYTNEEMSNYYYNWKKYDKNGNQVADFTPTYVDSAVGKEGYRNAISLGNDAVDTRAIFTVEITKEKQTT